MHDIDSTFQSMAIPFFSNLRTNLVRIMVTSTIKSFFVKRPLKLYICTNMKDFLFKLRKLIQKYEPIKVGRFTLSNLVNRYKRRKSPLRLTLTYLRSLVFSLWWSLGRKWKHFSFWLPLIRRQAFLRVFLTFETWQVRCI